VATGEKLISFSGSAGRSLAGAVSTSEKMMAAEKLWSGQVTIWDIASKKEKGVVSPKFKSALKDVVFSKDDMHIAVSNLEDEFVIFEVESGTEVQRGKLEGEDLADCFER